MMYKIYFISGVSGVGKSSTIKHLKESLKSEKYDIRDFDERGVPDGGGLEWLNSETRHWLDIAKHNAKNRRHTIICGFVNPELFKDVYEKYRDISYELILLHAKEGTIESRLRKRHSTQESIKEIERASGQSFDDFIKNSTGFAPELKKIFEQYGYNIISTDNKEPEEVSREIIDYINND